MSRWEHSVILLAVTLFGFTSSLRAQPVDEAGEAMEITVVAVQRSVQYRETANDPWKRVTPGMKISVGWEIRTGLRSAVQFKIGKDHTITVDRLGAVKVLNAIRRDNKVKTDVGMKYGRTKYVVDAVAEEHDSTVRAPSATLAVRGSEVTVSDNDAFGYSAMVGHSRDVNISPRGIKQLPPVLMQKGTIEAKRPPAIAQFDQGDGKPTGSAKTALAYARTGATPDAIGGTRGGIAPVETSLTRAEFRTFVDKLGESADTSGSSGGGGQRQRQKIKQQIQQGENTSVGFNVTGLDIMVQWTGIANVDMALRDPTNTLISPSTGAFGPNAVQVARPGGPATGVASPDDFGTGGNGFESVTFSAEHFSGDYTVFLRFDQNNSIEPANVQVKVVQQDPNAPMGMKVLRDVNGVLSPSQLNFAVPFFAPQLPQGGGAGGN